MSDVIEIRVPDIGDFDEVEVVELLVGPGDRVEADDSLVSIESDKATMEIPSPAAGVVAAVHVALGDRVSEGSLIVELSAADATGLGTESAAGTQPATAAPSVTPSAPATEAAAAPSLPAPAPAPSTPAPVAEPGLAAVDRRPGEAPLRKPPVPDEPSVRSEGPHASPGVRRFARELGVDLARTRASGPHGRVVEEDVKGFVRGRCKALSPKPNPGRR